MLIITRRTDEYVTIIDRESGRSFQVGIAELRGNAVRVGIDDRYDNFEVIRNELLPLTDPRRVENNPANLGPPCGESGCMVRVQRGPMHTCAACGQHHCPRHLSQRTWYEGDVVNVCIGCLANEAESVQY